VLSDKFKCRTVGGIRSAAGVLSCAALAGLVVNAVWIDPIPFVLIDVALVLAAATMLVARCAGRNGQVRRHATLARADKRLMSGSEHNSWPGLNGSNSGPRRE
jgi:hypothetical protein